MPLASFPVSRASRAGNEATTQLNPAYGMEEDEDCESEPRFQEEKWRHRLKTHSKVVTACLNPFELIPYLDSHQLLDPDDNEFLLLDTKTRKEKVLRILEILETSEERDVYTKFFACLTEELSRGEGIHIGHRYVVAVLKEEEYATDDDRRTSEACKKRIRKHRKDMHDIDLSSLVPVLFARHFLTTDERDLLLNESHTHIRRIEQLLQLLTTKGPLGHALFAQCLGEETSHLAHSELHKKITGAGEGSVGSFSRKRKSTAEDGVMVKVPRRTLDIIRMEDPLCGELYFNFVADVRECYQANLWDKLETTVQNFITANEDPQLRAMAVIEKGYSYSYKRGMRGKAMTCLDEARIMVRQLAGNNRPFLMARCKHIRATLYRYSGEEEKSYQENEEALELLVNPGCECTDDASRVMYGKATARLEKLGTTPNPSPREVFDTKNAFILAIDYGSKGHPGMCASRARCLIRLAQLSLGTTTSRASVVQATPESVKEAKGYLDRVDVKSVSTRCQSLYYLIESDLFKSMGSIAKAMESSQKALVIAEDAKLDVEGTSAESRIQALNMDLEALNIDSTNLETESTNVESLHTESADLEALNAESGDLEILSTESTDLEALNMVSTSLETLNTDLETLNTDLEASNAESTNLEAWNALETLEALQNTDSTGMLNLEAC